MHLQTAAIQQIHLIAAARPNFMKIAPLYHALQNEAWAEPVIVHTGQHYDVNMSDAFFRDLDLPPPHFHLNIGSGSHAEQTGRVMIAYEKLLLETRPNLVVVVGDVNSTLAATLAAVKIGIRVAHLEAGLRSFDRSMPEEINRVVTDSLADLLWTPSRDGNRNLLREGVRPEKIQMVGNIMIDSLEMLKGTILANGCFRALSLRPGAYGLVTLHRPANVDPPDTLAAICRALSEIALDIPLVFPVHPRTHKKLIQFNLLPILNHGAHIRLLEPISYVPFMNLVLHCRLIITDSGGVQEETTYLGIPCLTVRPNTERPVTIFQGSNQLCTIPEIVPKARAILENRPAAKPLPDLWDGRTAVRVVESIRRFLEGVPIKA